MAKSTTSNISIRMDSDLKAAAEALYEELGMNPYSPPTHIIQLFSCI